jgi:hypothetical protein
MLTAADAPARPLRCAQALQRCALRFRGGGAAHVRVFLPQWGYFARSAAAGAARLRARGAHAASASSAAAGSAGPGAQAAPPALFVGTTERFDDSLALLSAWAGWPLPAVRYAGRQRQYVEGHPTPRDWAPAEAAALAAALAAAGETRFHAAALAAWRAQASAFEAAAGGGRGAAAAPGANGTALAAATAALRALNAAPRSDAERAADRALRRRRHRPP